MYYLGLKYFKIIIFGKADGETFVIGCKFLIHIQLHGVDFYCYFSIPLLVSSETVDDSPSVCLLPQMTV